MPDATGMSLQLQSRMSDLYDPKVMLIIFALTVCTDTTAVAGGRSQTGA